MAYKTVAEIIAENAARKKWKSDHDWVYLEAVEVAAANAKGQAKKRISALAELMRQTKKDRYSWDMLSKELKADLTPKKSERR